MQLWVPEFAELPNKPLLNFGTCTAVLDSPGRKRCRRKQRPLCTFLVSKIKELKNRHRKEARDSLLELGVGVGGRGWGGVPSTWMSRYQGKELEDEG